MAATSPTAAARPLSLARRYPHEYAIWSGMKQRCGNERSREYRHYGGRGIRVCRRWAGGDGFRHFLADLGPQPFQRASVHRLDNDGPYAPRNVVWADPRTQARHMRTNRVLCHNGEKLILVAWAERMNMKPGTLGARLAKGWSVARALTQPVAPWRGRRKL